MMRSAWLLGTSFAAAMVASTSAAYPPTFTNTSASAQALLTDSMNGMLNSYWPGDGSGQFTGIVWFQNAALGIGLVHADMISNQTQWKSLVENMLDNCAKGDNQGALFQVGDWLDDVGWWGVLSIEAYTAYGQSGTYLGYAKSIHDTMYATYVTSCSGGIIWEYSQPQINTVTNTIFIDLAAKLWKATGDSTYQGTAMKVLNDWSSWALTSDGAVYDQLSSSCQQLYVRTWTYDSGPILMGLKTMYEMTQNQTYLTLGNNIATNAMNYFVYKGVMTELGCGEQNGQTCGQDMQSFKGIFAQGLGDWYITTKRYDIQQFLFTNGIANIQNNLSPDGSYTWGPSWLGPYSSSTANVKSTGSTNNLLAAIVQAADVAAIIPTTSSSSILPSSTRSSSTMTSSSIMPVSAKPSISAPASSSAPAMSSASSGAVRSLTLDNYPSYFSLVALALFALGSLFVIS